MRRRLDFAFKGERSYVQGPDIVDTALRAVLEIRGVGEVTNLVFAINRMTARSLDLVIDEQEPGDTAVASLGFESRRVKQRAVLVERPEQASARRPYNEDALRAACQIEVPARTIRLETPSLLTPLEAMVAMTKALHIALFPGKPGQWVFCRLEAPRWPLAVGDRHLAITLAHALGTRLTKSRASLGGELLAWIYFAHKERN